MTALPLEADRVTFPPAPAELQVWIRERSRDAAVFIQPTDVDLDWWNDALDGMPGAPVTTRRGVPSGEAILRRSDVFALADAAVADSSGEGAMRLLWHALAWGADVYRGNSDAHIRSVEKSEEVAGILRDAARLAATDPWAAFTELQPYPGDNAIGSLGPASFTKYLYFAGAGRWSHPCLIVNRAVLATLHHHTHLNQLRPRDHYDVETYVTAVNVLSSWAAELSTPDRPVAADEVERWAFAGDPS
jgi:hypothetical protein